MNAHRSANALSSAPALVEAAARTMGRIRNIAPFATPDMRLRLMGELELTNIVLDGVQEHVEHAARTTLKAMTRPRALLPALKGATQ